MDERAAFSPKEVIEKTGLSKNTVYRALKNGDIKSVRIGGRILIPQWAIEQLLREPITH